MCDVSSFRNLLFRYIKIYISYSPIYECVWRKYYKILKENGYDWGGKLFVSLLASLETSTSSIYIYIYMDVG